MYLTEGADAPRKPNALWTLWQWLVAAAFGFIALTMLLQPGIEVHAPGAPIALFLSANAVLALVAVIAAPPVFFRLPRLAKWLSYVGLLGALWFFGFASGEVQDVYDRSPAGIAAKAEEKVRAIEEAKAAKAEEKRLAEETASQAEEERKAKQDDVCKSLIPQVEEMAQSERGVEIIEWGRVSASSERLYDQELTCFADAITSVGDKDITFGLQKTPQGQVLVTLKIPR